LIVSFDYIQIYDKTSNTLQREVSTT